MRDQLEAALDAAGTGALLALGVVVAAVLFRPLARLFGWRPGWTLLTLLALAPVVAFTVPVDAVSGVPAGAIDRLAAFVAGSLHPGVVGAEVAAVGSDDERLANLLLFLPVGLFGTLATGAAVRTALAGAVLSLGVEGWQAVDGTRVASVADWLHNSVGAAVGALAGMLLVALLYRPRARPPAPAPVATAAPGSAAPGRQTVSVILLP